MRDSTDLVVTPETQNAADKNLVGAHPAFSSLVDLHHIIIYLLRDDRCRVFGSLGRQDDHEVSLRFHTKLPLDRIFQAPAEFLAVGALDRVHVGVGSRKEDVVEDDFLGARAGHGVMEVVQIGP